MIGRLASALRLPDQYPLMVSLVGAGGKTTTMLRLAEEYRSAGKKVLVSTTTKIFNPPETHKDALVLGESCLMSYTPLPGTIVVAADAIEANDKLCGFTAAVFEKIILYGAYDVILVEADGAKGRPIKAPAEYEPVIPQTTHVVLGLVGMDVLGQTVHEDWVHRCERFCTVTGAKHMELVSSELIIKLIVSDRGLFSKTPLGAAKTLVLNKCNDPLRIEAAMGILNVCLNPEFSTIMWGVYL